MTKSCFLGRKEIRFRCMGKITSVQLQKLVDSMLDIIKANSGSTKYQIKKIAFIFYSSAYVRTKF